MQVQPRDGEVTGDLLDMVTHGRGHSAPAKGWWHEDAAEPISPFWKQLAELVRLQDGDTLDLVPLHGDHLNGRSVAAQPGSQGGRFAHGHVAYGRYAFVSRIEGREDERDAPANVVVVDLAGGGKKTFRPPSGWIGRHILYLSDEHVTFAAVEADDLSNERVYRVDLSEL